MRTPGSDTSLWRERGGHVDGREEEGDLREQSEEHRLPRGRGLAGLVMTVIVTVIIKRSHDLSLNLSAADHSAVHVPLRFGRFILRHTVRRRGKGRVCTAR